MEIFKTPPATEGPYAPLGGAEPADHGPDSRRVGPPWRLPRRRQVRRRSLTLKSDLSPMIRGSTIVSMVQGPGPKTLWRVPGMPEQE